MADDRKPLFRWAAALADGGLGVPRTAGTASTVRCKSRCNTPPEPVDSALPGGRSRRPQPAQRDAADAVDVRPRSP